MTTDLAEEVAQANRRRIVVVDDNRSAAYLISKLLTMIGQHEVSVANDGEAALSTILQVAPEIVFLDIGLPGMDGYAVCRAIRLLPGGSELLLVALTGYGQAEDRLRSQEAGFDEHIVKPPSISQIRAVLKHPKLCAGPNS
jgi:CheY-like chemotaxis protein